jgi:hypothetical protein
MGGCRYAWSVAVVIEVCVSSNWFLMLSMSLASFCTMVLACMWISCIRGPLIKHPLLCPAVLHITRLPSNFEAHMFHDTLQH